MEITRYIILGLLLSLYIFFFLYWDRSKLDDIEEKLLYKSDNSILATKERLKPIIEDRSWFK